MIRIWGPINAIKSHKDSEVRRSTTTSWGSISLGENNWKVLNLDPALNFFSSAMFYHKHHLHGGSTLLSQSHKNVKTNDSIIIK